MNICHDRYNALLKKTRRLKEDNFSLKDIGNLLVQYHGNYKENSSFVCNLLDKGEGNCMARAKLTAMILQDLYGDEIELQLQSYYIKDPDTNLLTPHTRVIGTYFGKSYIFELPEVTEINLTDVDPDSLFAIENFFKGYLAGQNDPLFKDQNSHTAPGQLAPQENMDDFFDMPHGQYVEREIGSINAYAGTEQMETLTSLKPTAIVWLGHRESKTKKLDKIADDELTTEAISKKGFNPFDFEKLIDPQAAKMLLSHEKNRIMLVNLETTTDEVVEILATSAERLFLKLELNKKRAFALANSGALSLYLKLKGNINLNDLEILTAGARKGRFDLISVSGSFPDYQHISEKLANMDIQALHLFFDSEDQINFDYINKIRAKTISIDIARPPSEAFLHSWEEKIHHPDWILSSNNILLKWQNMLTNSDAFVPRDDYSELFTHIKSAETAKILVSTQKNIVLGNMEISDSAWEIIAQGAQSLSLSVDRFNYAKKCVQLINFNGQKLTLKLEGRFGSELKQFLKILSQISSGKNYTIDIYLDYDPGFELVKSSSSNFSSAVTIFQEVKTGGDIDLNLQSLKYKFRDGRWINQLAEEIEMVSKIQKAWQEKNQAKMEEVILSIK